MLAVLAFIVFVIAGILKLVGKHADWLAWLLIIGGLLVSAAVAWGWAGPRYYNRSRQAP
jgi:hypothetical protein